MPNPFTPEQIAQILEAFFDTVGTRQYIGARYVPIFGRKDEETINWDDSAPYEPLTIVLYQGNSYTSRQYVPAGVEITNELFWAQTGNYNAQVEQYRRDVLAYDGRITANAEAIAELAESTSGDVSGLQDSIDSLSESVSTQIVGLNTAVGNLETDLATLEDTLQDEIDELGSKCLWIGDSFSKNFNNYLPKKVAGMLHCDLVCTAVTGCGFVRYYNESTFQMQADALIAAYSSDPTVKYVIIYGGWNDREQTHEAIDEAVQLTFSKLNAAFPNAIKIMFGPQCPQPSRIVDVSAGEFMSWVAERYRYRGLLNNFVYIPAFTWNLAKDSSYWSDSDTTHPSEKGFDAIATYMLEGLFSNGCSMNDPYNASDLVYIRDTDPDVSNLSLASKNVWIHENKVYYNVTITGWNTDNPSYCYVAMPFLWSNRTPNMTNAPYGRGGTITTTRGATFIRVNRTDSTQNALNICVVLNLV